MLGICDEDDIKIDQLKDRISKWSVSKETCYSECQLIGAGGYHDRGSPMAAGVGKFLTKEKKERKMEKREEKRGEK